MVAKSGTKLIDLIRKSLPGNPMQVHKTFNCLLKSYSGNFYATLILMSLSTGKKLCLVNDLEGK